MGFVAYTIQVHRRNEPFISVIFRLFGYATIGIMTSLITAIIFDFRGVLLEWNPRHLYRRFFPDEPEAILLNNWKKTWLNYTLYKT